MQKITNISIFGHFLPTNEPSGEDVDLHVTIFYIRMHSLAKFDQIITSLGLASPKEIMDVQLMLHHCHPARRSVNSVLFLSQLYRLYIYASQYIFSWTTVIIPSQNCLTCSKAVRIYILQDDFYLAEKLKKCFQSTHNQ